MVLHFNIGVVCSCSSRTQRQQQQRVDGKEHVMTRPLTESYHTPGMSQEPIHLQRVSKSSISVSSMGQPFAALLARVPSCSAQLSLFIPSSFHVY
jgi:hypothetical protein